MSDEKKNQDSTGLYPRGIQELDESRKAELRKAVRALAAKTRSGGMSPGSTLPDLD